MIEIRAAHDRGNVDMGWLNSYHSFSFGQYYDPHHMGFSALRVINDDTVQPGAGFATHGHRNMEILSFVLDGTIAHKDSTGNIETLPQGEFQLMSAGRGIYHSEFNASQQDSLHFLQIWVEPNVQDTEPGYQQKPFETRQGFVPIASPDGHDGSFIIKQNATIYQVTLAQETQQRFAVEHGRRVYVHLITGELEINGIKLQPGDGAKIAEECALDLVNVGTQPILALLFDLP
ncbi:pirin family protein [Vibrio porteresiae]|uniref:Pirin family protein n=1 Tax=Vibrio porteresiae DSM 19223 TaxID=1123496 RepID=A0ABZ0QFC8_9VIBR|nr:pirin family protein [Vibrio porteresiae]WPC75194.1 pirin family protein [Vibrio porteresiae DSM 19223]